MKHTILLFLIQCMGLCAFAQKANDSIVRIDTSSVLVQRDFNEELSKKYAGDEFKYETKTGESQNLLARFINWIGQGLNRIFGIDISPQILQFLEYLIYILMALLAIYLLVKLFTNEAFNSIFTKKAKIFNDINLVEEHIETIDFNQLLQIALENMDYRLAIRYQFLLTLQRLSNQNLIQWHFDKTNSDYLKEIQQPLQLEFKKAVYLYEYIWYGDQPIDQVTYEKSILNFESINEQIPK